MGDEKSTLSVAERFLKRVGWPMVVIFYCPHLRTNTTSEEIEVQLGSTWSNFFIVFVYGHSPEHDQRLDSTGRVPTVWGFVGPKG